MFNRIITSIVRREFSHALRFDEDVRPELPAGDPSPRLLYLHVPFCEKLCPYCSFHRIPFREDLAKSYFRALRTEIGLYREMGYAFNDIYVGGGTPTVLMDELSETLALAGQCLPIRNISVETNPNHLTEEKLALLKSAGVTRLSVGVQSFDDGLLKAMDRYDKYGSGRTVADRLRAALGIFPTLNADMIFNFPAQSLTTLDGDLDVLLDLGMDQVTYYPLMVSDSTRQLVADTMGRVDYVKEARLYGQIINRLAPSYDLSSAWCFSRKKAASIIDEYIVDHDEYAGLGSGAIGYLRGTCYANTFDIPLYISQLKRGVVPLRAARNFNLREKIRYDFLMKLFSTSLNLSELRQKYGGGIYCHIGPELVAFFLLGAFRYKPPYLRLTKRGLYLWVIMMREFFIAVNNFRDYCRSGVAP